MSEKNTSPKPKDDRIRNITFMLYEDSCNPNWKQLLENEHIPFLYIYHDRDLNPTGEPKKPHWHVILCFEGKKSPEQLQYYVDLFGAANGVYQQVQSLRAMARYLCHMDNPDKAQYDSGEVVSCSIDYTHITDIPNNKYKAISEMISFCEDEGVISYRELITYAMTHRYDWFVALCDNATLPMMSYLKSSAWEIQMEEKRKSER